MQHVAVGAASFINTLSLNLGVLEKVIWTLQTQSLL